MNEISDATTWRKCSSCKKAIHYGTRHYVCSVSTCNGQRTGYVFCTVLCFERHLPGARHKDAAAIEAVAPLPSPAAAGTRRIITETIARGGATSPASASATRPAASSQGEVLVIASRLKDYIQMRSEFNTSSGVMDVLSQHLRILCEHAIDNARADGRKTVMERDFQFLKKS